MGLQNAPLNEPASEPLNEPAGKPLNEGWQLKRASSEHHAALMQLEIEIFAEEAWSSEALASELSAPHCHYLMAITSDGDVIGYAGLSKVPSSEQADIQTIAVANRYRGQGIARAMLKRLLAKAATLGAESVWLEVKEDNEAAKSLYRSLGFVWQQTRQRYYQPSGKAADVMRLELGPPVEPVVLGIETSCDETGVGIVRGNRLLANAISSSMDEHARFGGVVPEVAARAHLEALQPTLRKALADAGLTLAEVDAIAVTNGPGLAGALMVGVGAAKALAVSLDRPIYAVNHLVGHLGADVLDRGALESPTIALLVSGGHTSLLLVRDLLDDVVLLGETIDDAAGEAFDKVARLLSLGYPGGPVIDRAAAAGNPRAIEFPRALSLPKDLAEHAYDFSFSGLKTAVARYVEKAEATGEPLHTSDIAASFREAVVDVLVTKALRACKEFEVPRLLLGGGVVANARLREVTKARCEAAGVELRIPPLSLCTDNGAMIAAIGAQLIVNGHAPSRLDFAANSVLPIWQVQS